MHDLIGQSISSVDLKALLHQGPLTEVFLANDPTNRRQVAVEILRLPLEPEHLQDLFRADSAAVTALNHPGILETHLFGDLDSRPYVITAYAKAIPLARKLHELDAEGYLFPLHSVVRLIQRLASALSYAHSQEVLHKGLNPSSILLRADPAPKKGAPSALHVDHEPLISAFGIASLFAHLRGTSGVAAQLSPYLSPEQLRDEALDARTDVYALAAVAVELLTGQPPSIEGHHSLSSAQLSLREARLPTIPHIHRSLHEVLAQALSTDQNVRHASPKDFAKAFAAAAEVARTPITAPFRALYAQEAQKPPAHARSPSRRPANRWTIAALGLAVIAILAILAYLAWRILLDLELISNGRFIPVTGSLLIPPITYPALMSIRALFRRGPPKRRAP